MRYRDNDEKEYVLKLETSLGEIILYLSRNQIEGILEMEHESKVLLDRNKDEDLYCCLSRGDDQITLMMSTRSVDSIKLSFSWPDFLRIIQQMSTMVYEP